MKNIRCWSDMRAFGLDCLTGEACGLMYRILFDLTARGKQLVEKCFDVKITSEPWNRGSQDDPHVASIMLSPEMLVPLGIFALLEAGCTEVWLYGNQNLLGVEADDSPERIATRRATHPDAITRTFIYRGTAGARNVHMMSGRVQ